MNNRFDEVITSRERLREIVPEPAFLPDKKIDHIDPVFRRFIAACPFIVLSSKGSDGKISLSPRGDPAGFVHVLDDKTLAIPDRPGNQRIDTYENMMSDPSVGLIFLIPGYGYTLRVAGKASLVRDAALQQQMAIRGKEPDLVLIVTVEDAFMHCAKSITRSGLWRPDVWPDTAEVPSLAEALKAHAKLAESEEEIQVQVENDHDNSLY
ncbi:MAG: pyridoxamine 5'-phosphate oxidase family protein [Alphaproteobacteria bacterium]|jgi:hypothetical protein|nr:pyridoxamine 5'-phosphate oxidase family protein [Alphaproteobacteria bacterium]MBT4083251.1 pyridoxamine 5'-phosphate oxidase family protein [Alphaproteobacteria bacterium]MBT4544253.1 pyridoxamine 5'-phosphate oxidase family protein [Alphaproteobacteria bacterium]MBT7743810.1 pyridoxamine 5'-phosphate oxidase family protein [Alphaproteobacteria bacterium]